MVDWVVHGTNQTEDDRRRSEIVVRRRDMDEASLGEKLASDVLGGLIGRNILVRLVTI